MRLARLKAQRIKREAENKERERLESEEMDKIKAEIDARAVMEMERCNKIINDRKAIKAALVLHDMASQAEKTANDERNYAQQRRKKREKDEAEEEMTCASRKAQRQKEIGPWIRNQKKMMKKQIRERALKLL